MAKIGERELLACANMVIKTHGERAPLHVAERLGALAAEDDLEGVAVWRNIAAKIEALTSPTTTRPLQ